MGVLYLFDILLQGTDRDNNTQLQYSIQSQAPGQFWQINSVTGEITVNKPGGEGIKFKDGLDGRYMNLYSL